MNQQPADAVRIVPETPGSPEAVGFDMDQGAHHG
jgi:hypothetical protein